jgi:hypothetical protein
MSLTRGRDRNVQTEDASAMFVEAGVIAGAGS